MTDRRKVKLLIKTWVLSGIVILILGYAVFAARDFVKGPSITIESPQNGTTSTESLIDIHGSVKNISFLTLNGNKIFTDEAGVFTEQVLLSYGYNIMTLEAKDRFGRTVEKTLQLIYK